MAKSTTSRNDRIEVEVSNAAASRAGKRGLSANFHDEKGEGHSAKERLPQITMCLEWCIGVGT